ncbi:MAG: cysteine desulfurase [Elusimicrobia bacterium]|nr:cysteine desulfurase [Elusimicrobiota bacterium]
MNNGARFDVEAIRRDFPILRRLVRGKPLVYLDNAATSQKPAAVIEAEKSFYETYNANIHRGVHQLSEEATALMDEARAKVARFINAKSEREVIFTRNATEAINLVAYAWGRKFLKEGDEIALTEMEHHSNLVPWQILAQEKGVRLRFVPVTARGTIRVEEARRTITPRTKLFAFTAMSNALGTINPVPELLSLAKEAGAATLVDASQWTPHLMTDVAAWDCDFLAFSGHKMLGPTGIGVLYGKEKILESMDPFMGGGDMIQEVWLDHSTYGEVPFKFEAGTPNIAGAVAFGAAIDYLSGLGMEAVRRHELELTRRALEIVREAGAVELYGPATAEERGGVVSFNIADIHPHDVGQVFDSEGIAIRAGHHCCQPLMKRFNIGGTARASFYIYNTMGEVEAFGRALAKVKRFFKVPEEVNSGR